MSGAKKFDNLIGKIVCVSVPSTDIDDYGDNNAYIVVTSDHAGNYQAYMVANGKLTDDKENTFLMPVSNLKLETEISSKVIDEGYIKLINRAEQDDEFFVEMMENRGGQVIGTIDDMVYEKLKAFTLIKVKEEFEQELKERIRHDELMLKVLQNIGANNNS